MTSRVAPATETGLYAAFAVETGQILAGRFRVEQLLGMGAMGMVYVAEDLELGQRVAIKLLRPEIASQADAIARFRQEILLARQVTSPRVVRIHDLFRDGDLTLLAMDYVQGEPLDRRLERVGKLELTEAITLIRECAEGLQAAHARGIIHRDLKPANILIDADGHALISDFGIALSLTSDASDPSDAPGASGRRASGAASGAGMIVGTPDYLSPEQARGGELDGRSDLYALGLVAYEALTGVSPFADLSSEESLSARLRVAPNDVRTLRPDTPAWLAQLLRRLLRPARAQRLPDAAAVIRAIDQRQVATGARHRKSLLLAGISAGLLTLTLSYYWLRAHPPQPGEVPTAAAPAPALPPRWLLLPLLDAEQQFATDALSLALGEGLGLLLDGRDDVAVIGSERTQVALSQLRATRADAKLERQLASELGSIELLAINTASAPAGVRLRAGFHGGANARPGVEAEAPDRIAATRALAIALGVPEAHWGELFGAPSARALELLGEGLQLRREGQIGTALKRFTLAIAEAPGLNLARLQQLELSLAVGDRTLAAQLLEAIPGTLAGAAGLQRTWLQALVEGQAPAPAHPLQLAVTREPNDLEARLRLIQALGEAGERPQALTLLRALVKQDRGDPRIWFLLGKYSILTGEVRPAVDEYLVQALVLFKRSRNRFGEGEVANALGVGYGRLGQTEDAEQQYRQALKLRELVGNRRGQASTLRNLAQIALIRGELDLAQSQLEQASLGFQALGDDAGVIAVDNELGLLSEERGDYSAAIENYRRALRGRERLEDAFGAAEAMNNIGFAHFQLGDLDSAQVYWRQAGEAFTRLADLPGQVRIEQNLGLLATARGNWAEAETRLLRSIELAEAEQMVEELSVSMRNLAELRLLQGRLADALAAVERANTLFVEREDHRGRTDGALLHARVLLAGADGPAALAMVTAMGEDLAGSSLEHQALAALLLAELAPGKRVDQLDIAAHAAARAGVESLRLRVAVARQPADAALTQAVERLGHAPLTLDAAVAAIEALNVAGKYPAAVARYVAIQPLLREIGTALVATRLHRAGAKALAGAGNTEQARTADAAADSAFADLLAAAPPALAATLRASAPELAEDLPANAP